MHVFDSYLSDLIDKMSLSQGAQFESVIATKIFLTVQPAMFPLRARGFRMNFRLRPVRGYHAPELPNLRRRRSSGSAF